jgi:hypothetical protein
MHTATFFERLLQSLQGPQLKGVSQRARFLERQANQIAAHLLAVGWFSSWLGTTKCPMELWRSWPAPTTPIKRSATATL